MSALPYRRSRVVGLFVLLLALVIPIATDFDLKVRAATDLVVGGQAQVSDAQGDNVNLRDAPSYAGPVLASVAEGTIVDVLDGPFTDDIDGTIWYQINASGQPGYMLADYLVNADESVSPAAAATTTASVNLRSGAGTGFAVLLVIPNGATVNTTGAVQNGFTQLTYNGITGWSASQYISVTGASTAAIVADGPLNLRSAPNTTAAVLAVMPTGASLTITGALTNGFYPVEYNGTAGYAAAEFLQIVSSQTATTTASVNLRSGAGTTFAVLLVIPSGATVNITGSLTNGFYPVVYNGTSGFASATYLQIGGTGPSPTATPINRTAFTTANLNLRSSASTAGTVLLVIPNGSQITVTGNLTNGFYPVRFGTTNGFASSTYISFTSPSPTASPTPTTRAAWTTANLNLRSAASSTATVLLVIPNGSQITVTGNLSNGFYPVRFGATNGFASSTYITFTAPVVTPTPTTPPTGGLIVWPVTGGTWEVIQGYNGSSHQNTSAFWQYLYSLDIARTTGDTAGVSAFAPVSGTVSWFERASGGITINMGNGYAIAMFHLTVDRSWEPGDVIQQGDFIGTISPPGGEGFVQVPHIHFTLWQTSDGGNFNRIAAPFTGQFTISGSDFPSNGSAFQWSGFEFQP